MNKPFIILAVSLLLVIGCSNKDKPAEQNIVAVGDIAVADEDITDIEEYEEGSLEFFNPIGIIGTGVVQIDNYIDGVEQYYDSISIYNDLACEDLYSKYDFATTYGTPKGKNIIPIYNKADYGYYCFVCVGSHSGAYEIAINAKDRKYIEKAPNIKYYDWEQFFNKVFYLDPAEGDSFRVSPDDNAEAVEFENYDDYELYDDRETKLEGEWLHLNFPKAGKQAWVRWRRGDDIIITVYISV